jgi:hypothetical protein
MTDILSGGSDTFTATYAGSADYAGSTSNALASLVADFSVTFSPSSPAFLAPGESQLFTITVTPQNGAYNKAVTLSVTGLPSGATAIFNPSSLTPGDKAVSAALIITDPPLMAQSRSTSQTLRIAVLFALLLPIAGLYRGRRRLWRSLLMLPLVAITLALASGLSGCGTSGFFNQPPKNYTVTVTGSSGTEQESTVIHLTVE